MHLRHQAIPIIIIPVLLLVLSGNSYAEESLGNDYTWHVDFDEKGYILIRGSKIDPIKHDIHRLVAALNQSSEDPEHVRTPENREPTDPPKVKLLGIDKRRGVVRVEVINDFYLTQKMGSTGAEWFLASVTFTLTEYKQIKFVDLVLREGDHAAPGRYSRRTFLKQGDWYIKTHDSRLESDVR